MLIALLFVSGRRSRIASGESWFSVELLAIQITGLSESRVFSQQFGGSGGIATSCWTKPNCDYGRSGHLVQSAVASEDAVGDENGRYIATPDAVELFEFQ